MKILHIITSLRVGGAEFALLNRLKAMSSDASIEHVVLYFYEGPVVALIQELGIKVILVRGAVKGYDPLGLWRVYSIARAFKPDIIHTSLWAANMVGRLLGALLNTPIINELHGNVSHEGWLRNIMERWSLRGVHRLVAVSASVQATYEHHIMPVLSKRDRNFIAARLVTVPNGIDRIELIARIQNNPLQRAGLGLEPDDFVIGAIGRFEKIKSYDLLIRSVAYLCTNLLPIERSKIKLCLVGDGSQRALLEQLVKDYGLERQVIFTGYRLDAYRFYPLFDCFALSSQSEGLSIALLEAMALGLPIISTHLMKTHDAIEHGKNGLLIPVNDVAAYAQGLANLYHKKIKKSGNFQPLFEFPFSIHKVVQTYHDVYRQLSVK
jgi:glycosyltransferase involved in cell wall biosynthesis